MNFIFTIVAKNYLSFAITLANSVKTATPSCEFYILVADDLKGVAPQIIQDYNIIIASSIGINKFNQMSFKYNVTEFSTAIKPFFIDYLFQQKNASKVIYLDPDIYVYNSLNYIFNLLDKYVAIITPHIVTMETAYSGNNPEPEFLFAGIYNLGFFAIKNCSKGNDVVNWWMNRLTNWCYGERLENLHVDQKWIDFLPALLTIDELNICRHPGLNIAYWNIHERIFTLEKDNALVRIKGSNNSETLIFLHFSGLNPLDIHRNKQCQQINISNYPLWENYIKSYAEIVLNNHFEQLFPLEYSFNTFNNGETILPLHRRLFRKLLDTTNDKFTSNNPFTANKESFYGLLEKNKLLIGNTKIETKINEGNLAESNNKLKKINLLLRLLLKLIGLNKYITLLRFLQKYFKAENQLFLIMEYRAIAENNYFKAQINR